MSCPDRDSDLLMLAMGEGDALTRLGTQVHLLRCASCRRRYQDFTAVSDILARATRPEPLSSTIPLRQGFTGLRPSVALAVILLVTLLLTAMLLAAQYGTSGVSCERPASVSGPVKTRVPCAPDLPNDHCR